MRIVNFTQTILIPIILITGCMKDTNDRLANMDKSTSQVAKETERIEHEFEVTNKRLELVAKELELVTKQMNLLNSHIGQISAHASDVSGQLKAFQEYAAILSLEMKNVTASLNNMATSLGHVGDLAEMAKTMMSSMIEQAFSTDTPPPETDDLDDLLNPRPTPTPSPASSITALAEQI
ncbi:MAG: hypothetical protein SGI74_03690 [Oligoflexia bacterium]|nr:hypothetical protein [Oligoflexia bacterium]